MSAAPSAIEIPKPIRLAMRCPRCGARLSDDEDVLKCAAGHALEVVDGFIDASAEAADEDTRRTFESFGYEWTRFSAVNDEDERFWHNYFADVDLDWLRNQVCLDAGCGKARYTRITARHSGPLVALDGSEAVRAAVTNLAEAPQAVVVRSDLRSAPFADGSFGFVSCLGVLHHLPDPEAGFQSLARLVAPGGRFLVYLYSSPEGQGVRATALRVANALRRVTTHVPHRVLRPVSLPLAAFLYATFVVPGWLGERLGWRALSGLPLDTYRGFPLRSLWLDTFDRLSAPIENRYTIDDVAPWFATAGLELETWRSQAGLYILGRRSAL